MPSLFNLNKLSALLLGAGLILSCAATVFAQETPEIISDPDVPQIAGPEPEEVKETGQRSAPRPDLSVDQATTTGSVTKGPFVEDFDRVEEPSGNVLPEPVFDPYRLLPFVTHRTVSTTTDSVVVEFAFNPPKPYLLPARFDNQFWVAAPGGSVATATLEDARWSVWNVRDKRVEGPFSSTDETSWGKLPVSLSQLRIGNVDTFRQVGLNRFEVNLVAPLPRVDDLRQVDMAFISRMQVRFRVPPSATPVDLASEDPWGLELMKPMVLNPEQLPFVASPPQAVSGFDELAEWNQRLATSHAEGVLLHAELPRWGIYGIDGETLRAAGLNPDNLDSSRLQFFYGKTELTVYAHNLTGNRLVGRGRLYFVIPEDREDRKSYFPLWITLAPPGVQPLRAPLRTTSFNGEKAVESYVTSRVFEPKVYEHKMPLNAPQMRWATASLPVDRFETFDFEASPLEGTMARSEIRLWTAQLRGGVAVVEVFINGTKVFSELNRGARANERTIEFDTALLRRGVNSISINNKRAPDEASVPFSFIQAEITVPSDLGKVSPFVPATLRGDISTTHTLIFDAGGSDDLFALVADITNRESPSLSLFSRYQPSVDHVFFGGSPASPANDLRVVHVPIGSARPVLNLRAIEPPRAFLEKKQVDYLVIAHSSLIPSLAPLIEHRSKTYSVDVLSVEDVYAAFSYGDLKYEAIEDAIRHTFAGRETPRLQSVMLVGEGSDYWWENRVPSSNVTRNLIPIHGFQNLQASIRGDDSYALVQGPGPLADVELGRISTEIPEQLDGIVQKILNYENNHPPGEWLHRHLIVTDDEPEFKRVAREVIAKSLRGAHYPIFLFLQDFPYEDYFREIWRKRSSTMTDELLRRWREGALTITYIGHGGPNLWSSERILHNRDVEFIEDGGRHPFLVSGSCDTGWVDYPVEPVRSSLAEQLTRNPKGGAIAAFIPIDGTSSFEHNYLLTAFFKAMQADGYRRAGTISLLSKINYHLPRNNFRVTNQYLLMGDPGLMLPEPPQKLNMTATPTELLRDQEGAIDLEGFFPGAKWGSVDVFLLDREKTILSRGRFRLVNTAFFGKLPLPRRLDPGEYELMAIAVSEDSAVQGATSTGIVVHPHNIQFAWKTDPPMDQPVEAGTPMQVSLNVVNDSPLPIVDGMIRLEDLTGREVFAAKVSAAPGATISQSFPSPLPPGINRIRGRLFAREGDRRSVAESDLILVATSLDGRPLDVSVPETRIEFLPNGAGTRVSLPTVGILPVTLTQFTARLIADLDAGPIELGVRRVGESRFAEKRWLVYTTPATLPAGRINFRLQLADYATEELLSEIPFEVDLTIGQDIEWVGDLTLDNLKPYAGTTVFVNGRIRNRGNAPAYRVKTNLYLGTAWDDKAKAPISTPWEFDTEIDVLLPREEREVRLRWDPSGARGGTQILHATASSNQVEADMANNVASLEIVLSPASNLRLLTNEVVISHQVVQPYDRVRFSAPVINDSANDFTKEFRVVVSARNQNGGLRRLLSRRYSALAKQERATVQFDWLVEPGETSVEINVNADREYLELTYDDNMMSSNFPYVIPAGYFAETPGSWNFTSLLEYASFAGVVELPGSRLVMASEPRHSSQRLGFSLNTLVAGDLGPPRVVDNLVELYEGHQLLTTWGEVAAPVKFRIPLDPNDGTSYYDVQIYAAARDGSSNELRGIYRYRLEDDPEWHVEDRQPAKAGIIGRLETADDHLTFEFASTEAAAFNHILGIFVWPVTGEITSPIVTFDRLPPMALEAKTVLNGDSQTQFLFRYGSGTNESLKWQDWTRVELGEVLPAPPKGPGYLQWKARLIGTPTGTPEVEDIRLVRRTAEPAQGAPAR